MKDPIDNVTWRPSRTLKANHYNPNVVFTPELRLLENSILDMGWIFPIVISVSGIIIDGFHRWRLSMDSKQLVSRYAEEVPCVVVDCSDADAMMLTVRMNRAKGTHVAVRMSSVVQELHFTHGKTVEQIATGIGANKDEVLLLLDGDIFKHRDLDNYRYSKAWVPMEVSQEERDQMVSERDDSLAPDEIS